MLCPLFTKDTAIIQKSDFTVNDFPNQTSKNQFGFMVTIKKKIKKSTDQKLFSVNHTVDLKHETCPLQC